MKNFLAVLSVLLFTGCSTVTVDRYNTIADNVNTLKEHDTKLSVGSFTADKSIRKIPCRLAANISMPDQEPIETYIQNAIKEEIKMAGMFSEHSPLKISANVSSVTVSSGMTDGHWTIILTVKNSAGQSIDITNRREYASSFAGAAACIHHMPKNFLPTVQELINKIINHPEFTTLFPKPA